MAKKVKSYQKNMKTVMESIQKTSGVEMPDTNEIMKQIPPETMKEMTDSVSKAIGGDMFTKYISEFMNIFKVISFNVEMNTAGLSALSNNSKFFNSTLERIVENQTRILVQLKEIKNAK